MDRTLKRLLTLLLGMSLAASAWGGDGFLSRPVNPVGPQAAPQVQQQQAVNPSALSPILWQSYWGAQLSRPVIARPDGGFQPWRDPPADDPPNNNLPSAPTQPSQAPPSWTLPSSSPPAEPPAPQPPAPVAPVQAPQPQPVPVVNQPVPQAAPSLPALTQPSAAQKRTGPLRAMGYTEWQRSKQANQNSQLLHSLGNLAPGDPRAFSSVQGGQPGSLTAAPQRSMGNVPQTVGPSAAMPYQAAGPRQTMGNLSPAPSAAYQGAYSRRSTGNAGSMVVPSTTRTFSPAYTRRSPGNATPIVTPSASGASQAAQSRRSTGNMQ